MLAAGRLPALAGLRERGVWHELDAPATQFAAGAQHTLYSGVELADHGLFYPFQWSAPDQRVRYMSDFAAPAAGVGAARRRGRRTLAVDPYESRPPTDAAARARSSAAGSCTTGSCCSSGRRRPGSTPGWSAVRPARSRRRGVRPQHAVDEMLRAAPRPARRAGRVADAAALLLGRVVVRPGVADVLRRRTWPGTSSGTCPSSTPRSSPTRRVLGGALDDVYAARRRRARPHARRPARGDGRDGVVAGGDGRQHQPRRHAPRDARRRAHGRGRGRTPTRGSGFDLEAAGRAADRAAGARSRRRCPSGWRST